MLVIAFLLLNIEVLLVAVFLTMRSINRSIKHQTALDELDREERAELRQPLSGRR